MKVETKSLVLCGWLVRMRDLEEVNANRSIEGRL